VGCGGVACAAVPVSSAKESRMILGVCLNSLMTAVRVSAASSRNGLSSYNLGKLTVTDVSRPLFQLNPTWGFTPVVLARSLSTARVCFKPSVTRLTASHPASAAAARIRTATVLYMAATDPVCFQAALTLSGRRRLHRHLR